MDSKTIFIDFATAFRLRIIKRILREKYNYEYHCENYEDNFLYIDKKFWYSNISLLADKFIAIREWLKENNMEDFQSWTNREKVLFKLRWR